jgi:hypothetical protein
MVKNFGILLLQANFLPLSKIYKKYIDEAKAAIKNKKYDTKHKYMCLQVRERS